MRKEISPLRFRLALFMAGAADFLQIVLFPFFGEGFGSPFEACLDVGICFILTGILGWHLAFLPTFFVEMLPGLDLVPTWTIAVLVATRKPGSTLEV